MSAAYFDTHTHLQDVRYGGEQDMVIDRAMEVGVRHMVACGTRESDWDAVLELAQRRTCVLPLLGLHPWFASEASPRWLETLRRHARDWAIGIGECGLDFAEEGTDREVQEEVFRAQLALARETNRPVSIHCRKAWERLEVILQEDGIPAAGAVVHSFSGSAEVALELQRMKVHLSFSCSLANPANKKAAKAVRAVSLDHLLLETDSPDIPPRHLADYEEGQLNEPANIRLVAQAAARLRAQDEKILARSAYENAERVFGWLLNPV